MSRATLLELAIVLAVLRFLSWGAVAALLVAWAA